jgi:ATP-dependent DNA ligase
MDSGAWRGFPSDWYPPAPVPVFPFAPMLAALKHSLPIGDQWLYEPKLDGFRGLLRHGTNGHVQVLSRNLRDLAPSFPQLKQAARSLPAGTLVDGEIVIADESGNADFGALQQRLTVARHAAEQVALQRPAVLLVFDVLELRGVALTELPLRNRRKRLEDFLPGLHPSLQLMAQTRDPRIGAAVARAVARIGGRGGQEIGWPIRAGAAKLGKGKAPADR